MTRSQTITIAIRQLFEINISPRTPHHLCDIPISHAKTLLFFGTNVNVPSSPTTHPLVTVSPPLCPPPPGYTAAGTPYKVPPNQSNGAPPPYTPSPSPYQTAMYPIRSAYPQQNLYTQVGPPPSPVQPNAPAAFIVDVFKHNVCVCVCVCVCVLHR